MLARGLIIQVLQEIYQFVITGFLALDYDFIHTCSAAVKKKNVFGEKKTHVLKRSKVIETVP